jgi:hypothetical protein
MISTKNSVRVAVGIEGKRGPRMAVSQNILYEDADVDQRLINDAQSADYKASGAVLWCLILISCFADGIITAECT